MTEGKINLWEVTIKDKKGSIIKTLEVVGASKQQMEEDIFYKKRSMMNAGYDIKTDKWNVDKFIFSATLIKNMDEPILSKT